MRQTISIWSLTITHWTDAADDDVGNFASTRFNIHIKKQARFFFRAYDKESLTQKGRNNEKIKKMQIVNFQFR